MKKFVLNHIFELVGGIFSIIGIGVLAVGIILILQSKAFMENAVQVDGVIDEIDIFNHSDDTDYDIYVSYYYDGKEYNHVKMNYSSSSMYEGEEIELYIDPESPTDFKTKEEDTFLKIFFPAFGGVFTLIGLPMLIVPLGKKARNKKLLDRGQHVYAVIESINLNLRVTINGRNPYMVFCSYKNPSDGIIYKFKSENLMFNPNDSYKVGDNVDVYIEPENLKHYYVDVIDKMAPYVKDYT